MNSINNYKRIINSSTIIGGSEVIKIAISIVQVKILAVLLGPTGIGLAGLYQSAIGIAVTLSGLGIERSGVRQVAEAATTGDQGKIARTIRVLRRVAVILGIFGMIVVLLGRKHISQITFGNTEHADAFAILSVILLFASISGGQRALLQGMRRIGDLAKLGIIGSLCGLTISVPIAYVLGVKGIAPYLATASATAILTSWWYARKIHVLKVKLKTKDILVETKSLVSLGMMLMLSTLMTTLVMYLIRVVVVRNFGIEAAGYYQAASQLSNVYIGFILGAMGMDFYPRLTALAGDNESCNRLVNEQAEIGLLMAVPGLLATLTFAPIVIKLFYSDQFIPAYGILQWQVMGTFIQVASWPLGYVQLAKGAGKGFLMTNFALNAVHILFIWLATWHFGLVGTGIAFFGLYVFHIFFIYAVVKRLSGFTWSNGNKWLGLIITPPVAVIFLITQYLPTVPAVVLGTMVTLVMSIYCLKKLHVLVGAPTLIEILDKIKKKIGRDKV